MKQNNTYLAQNKSMSIINLANSSWVTNSALAVMLGVKINVITEFYLVQCTIHIGLLPPKIFLFQRVGKILLISGWQLYIFPH